MSKDTENVSIKREDVCEEMEAADVLVPVKPIRDYEEFECYSDVAKGVPEYRFQIKNLDKLIVQKEVELLGKVFPVPGFTFQAQVSCIVRLDHFLLSIRFVDPEKLGKPVEIPLNPIVNTVVVANGANRENVQHVFPWGMKFVYGEFYFIGQLLYIRDIKNAVTANSVTLHLFVKNVTFPQLLLDEGIFMWRIDVAHFTSKLWYKNVEEDMQVALSPIIYKEQGGIRAQIRMHVEEESFWVEVVFLKEEDENPEYVRMELTVIHKNDPSERIEIDVCQEVKARKSSCCSFLGTVQELNDYICGNKLLVMVEMK